MERKIKILSSVIIVMLLISLFTIISSAKNVLQEETVESKDAVAPILDGILGEDEYENAVLVDIKGEDLVYYADNSAGTWYGLFPSSMIPLKRDNPSIGDSKVYVLPTEEGIYFGIYVADSSIGANYVREPVFHGGLFNGDSFHIIFKSNNDAVSTTSLVTGQSLRLSVSPSLKDSNGYLNGYRTIDPVSAITTQVNLMMPNVQKTTSEFGECATSDENGYTIELLVKWEQLKEYGFTGESDYKNGNKLYLNFAITDSLSLRSDGTTVDWGIYNIPVNSSFQAISDLGIKDDIQGIMIAGGKNWDSYEKDTGLVITMECEENTFIDVIEGEYYYKPVLWAIKNNVTKGITENTYCPDDVVTRGQVVTFLYRALGEPKTKSIKNPFEDINSNEYYYKAVMWAYSNGITMGVDETHFDPNGVCTRGQVVTFMYRALKMPSVKGIQCKFEDVIEGQYYYNAVLWADSNNITNGLDDTHFYPNAICTRGQIVTFLFRETTTINNPNGKAKTTTDNVLGITNERELSQFAFVNTDTLVGDVKGIVVWCHGLGDISTPTASSALATRLGQQGILFVYPFYNPWAWCNDDCIAYIDACIDGTLTAFELDENTPIVIYGGSMGGLTSLMYTVYGSYTPVGIVSLCPVGDLETISDAQPSIKYTIYNAYAGSEIGVEAEIVAHSPLANVAKMKDVPYLVVYGASDFAIPMNTQILPLQEKMEQAGLDVEFLKVDDMGHCNIDQFPAAVDYVDNYIFSCFGISK